MPIQIDSIAESLKHTPDQLLEYEANRELIEEILRLRDEKNALILGHNYMAPLVYQLSGVEERGDSLALSRRAAEADNPIILFDGVRFMAETAKILSPDKKVLIADLNAGCSLADPFTPDDVLAYKEKYPDAPVVTYINSYADIKAVSDYCCTSSNAMQVVLHASRKFNSKDVIFFPDSLMGKNIEKEIAPWGINIIYPGKDDDRFGRCEVHEQFKPEHIIEIRRQYDIPRGSDEGAVLVHWECPPDVVAEADYCGSTSQMGQYIQERPQLKRVFLATECEMAANLASEFPSVEFVRTCNIHCQHMRQITLEKILDSLRYERYEVDVDPGIAQKALTAINRMLEVPPGPLPQPE